ncbi:MAG: energy transducer TonB [Bacteroidales bacterium]|nr:energy transducer TonB [Bacteroidales bacterium]
MEVKKSDKANIEKTKNVFLEAGLVVALAVVICAFEWKSYDKKAEAVQVTEAVAQVEEMVIQTKQDEPEPPQQEVEQQQSMDFEIVDDDQELKNEVNLADFTNDGGNADVFIPKVEVKVQEDVVDDDEAPIFTVVEQTSEFPGGYNEMQKFIASNIKYPSQARETGTQGTVYVTFVVERDGSITDIKVLRDIGSGCGEEAIRVVKLMPKWKPAKQRGKAVRQQFNLPVKFVLQ